MCIRDRNKAEAWVGTSGLNTKAGISSGGRSGGGFGVGFGGGRSVSRASMTRRSDGGVVSSEAEGAKEARRASVTRYDTH